MEFSVACIARERPEVLARFIAHYAALGAARIFIFYDDAPRPEIAALAGTATSPVEIEFLDEAFWRETLGEQWRMLDPKIFFCFSRAKARCATPWLFLTDADELLIARTPIAEALAAVPAQIDAVAIPTVEAVWGPDEDIDAPFGSTWFRRPIHGATAWRLLGRALYGRHAVLFRKGLLGHHSGKHFVRTAARFDHIGSHASTRGGRNVTPFLPEAVGPGFRIDCAHFDAISFARWREKFERRIAGLSDAQMRDARNLQVAALAEALRSRDPAAATDAARALFRALHQLTPWRAALLRAAGKAFRDADFAASALRGAS